MANKNFETLEIGKTYLNRKGDKVHIVKRTDPHTLTYMGQDCEVYMYNGKYLWSTQDDRDLISLVEESPPKSLLKDRMVVRMANGEYRLVLAGRFTTRNGHNTIADYTNDLRNIESSEYTVQEIFTIKDVSVSGESLLTSIWVRPEKSAKDLEIEELQATLESVTQKLNKLKEGN